MTPITYPARPLSGGRFGLLTSSAPCLWSFKANGWRALVHNPTGTMFNRLGEQLTIANEFHLALGTLAAAFPDFEWLDCEALERRHNIGRGTLMVLDLVRPNLTADARYTLLTADARLPILNIGQQPGENRAYIMRQDLHIDAFDTDKFALTQLWHTMQQLDGEWNAEFYEGFVKKRADSLYPIQLRDPDSKCPYWTKFRFVNVSLSGAPPMM